MLRTIGALALAAVAALAAAGDPPAARAGLAAGGGYYSARQQGPGYSYRQYHYYSRQAGGYRHHVAVYHPRAPRYVYYYNPYKRRYWGRYDLATGGYSLLAVPDRRETLSEIPESAFPPAGPMPPEEDGGDPMLPPPEPGPEPGPTTPAPPRPGPTATPPYIPGPDGKGCGRG